MQSVVSLPWWGLKLDTYQILMVLTVLAAFATGYFFWSKFKRETAAHKAHESWLLANASLTNLDPADDKLHWKVDAVLDLDRNMWTKWNALASTLLALIGIWYAVFSLIYTERDNRLESKAQMDSHRLEVLEATTKSFHDMWNERLSADNRFAMDKMIRHCRHTPADLEDWVRTAKTCQDKELYMEYATILSILNMFEHMSISYNHEQYDTDTMYEQYGARISDYYAALKPFVEASRKVYLDENKLTAFVPVNTAPWYEVEEAIKAWDLLKATH